MANLNFGNWAVFDQGHSDKLLFRQTRDGEHTQDVLFKHTPWVGGVPTSEDLVGLEDRATNAAIMDERVVLEY